MNTTEAEIVPEPAPPQTALATTKPMLPTAAPAPALTAQQARIGEINGLLAPAYEKASTLELSDPEIAALLAPFPDNVVEVRPNDGLIYIPHIHISNRLNAVLKPGRWSLVCRRHWLGDSIMYGEYVLLIRGCFIGESVGGHPYIASNPKTNYSDALESTAAEALRRICGKRLGIGAQVWDPDYARRWCAAWSVKEAGRTVKRQQPLDLAAKTGSVPHTSEPAPPASAPAPRDSSPGPGPGADTVPRGTVKNPAPAKPATKAGHPYGCPHCQSTATNPSKDLAGMMVCGACGWQWDKKTGRYHEEHIWMTVLCPIPPKGVKKKEYVQETLGQIMRTDSKRAYGLAMNHSAAKARAGYDWNDKHYPGTPGEVAFGEACELAKAHMASQRSRAVGALKQGAGEGEESMADFELRSNTPDPDEGDVPF